MLTYFDIRVLDLSCALMIVLAGIMWLAPANNIYTVWGVIFKRELTDDVGSLYWYP
jgi:hypothetical protein